MTVEDSASCNHVCIDAIQAKQNKRSLVMYGLWAVIGIYGLRFTYDAEGILWRNSSTKTSPNLSARFHITDYGTSK